jgi:hypothetical protein
MILPEKEKVDNKARSFRFLILFAALMIFSVDCFDCVWATASVSVSPSSTVAGAGQSFSVNVTISDVIDLYGWEFKLNWSAACLEVVTVTEGLFLRNGGEAFFTFQFNNTEGHLIADCTLLGNVFGVTGNGVLATVTFYVKAAGESVLDLYYVALLDSSYPEPQTILCQTVGGYWSTLSQHDVSITNISVLPTIVFPGQIVNVNTTVSNEGRYPEAFNVTVYVNSQPIQQQSVSLNEDSSTSLLSTWNTTGFGKGEYVISCYASIVPGEVDIADNNRTSSDTVTLLVSAHDVAVTGVKASKIVVGQGFCMFINVTVKNFGTYSETFNTITYANDTAIHADAVSLASGQGAELSLFWNTSSFLMSKYLIRSYAEPVSLEADVSDNTGTFGLVTVAKRGDITSVTPNVPDGKVDMRDLAAVARPFGMRPGGSLWNGNADITGITLGLPDNVINMRDVSWVAINFGK